jgi:nucleoside-diphosphate-sugar epimerase
MRALAARGHQVRGFDRVPVGGQAETVVGNLVDRDALVEASRGVDAVIHLAATPDDDDFLSQLVPNNIVGVYQVLEAARLCRVPRVILASTGQVNWVQLHAGPWPVRVTDRVQPRYWYAATKVFAEAAGEAYARTHSMDVLAVRLGSVPRSVEQVKEICASELSQDVYLSPADAGRFFVAAIEANAAFGFEVVFATSRPGKIWRFDPEPAKRLLGYEPQDRWPDGLEEQHQRALTANELQ